MIKTAAFDAQRNENADSWQTELKARVEPRQRDSKKEPEKEREEGGASMVRLCLRLSRAPYNIIKQAKRPHHPPAPTVRAYWRCHAHSVCVSPTCGAGDGALATVAAVAAAAASQTLCGPRL